MKITYSIKSISSSSSSSSSSSINNNNNNNNLFDAFVTVNGNQIMFQELFVPWSLKQSRNLSFHCISNDPCKKQL